MNDQADRWCSAPGCAEPRTRKYAHALLCEEHERRWRQEGWRLTAGNAANEAKRAAVLKDGTD